MQVQSLSPEEINDIEEGISQSFAMTSAMMYVPLVSRIKDSSINRYGEAVFIYNEAGKFPCYGCMETQTNANPDLDRHNNTAKNRDEGILKLVFRDIINNGYRILEGDAVDILNEYGEYDRWIIFGTAARVELPNILTRLFVIKSSTIASG